MSLRVIDAGTVGPGRSQALWHGIAAAMAPGAQPTLSLCRPAAPYVGIGFHRRLEEVDLDACRADGLPIIRRRIGGGPVWLDSDQLFFQLTVPARAAPPAVDRLYALALAPAVEAFRAFGLDARLDGLNDIAVAERKLSGTGAGRFGEAVTVVGNVILRFPHERMVRVLALPSRGVRRECLRLMRRHVSSLETEGLAHVTAAEAAGALVGAYAHAFGPVRRDEPTARERGAIARWEARFADPAWLAGPDLPPRRLQVKVRHGVYVAYTPDGMLVRAEGA